MTRVLRAACVGWLGFSIAASKAGLSVLISLFPVAVRTAKGVSYTSPA
jgi:ABC-type nitrate/sulfonate/bicarbonate transport system permease component